MLDKDQWVTWYNLPDKEGMMPSVREVFPKDTPDRAILRKMGKLIKKGLIVGCTCGCRGDFELTEKGKNYARIYNASNKDSTSASIQ